MNKTSHIIIKIMILRVLRKDFLKKMIYYKIFIKITFYE